MSHFEDLEGTKTEKERQKALPCPLSSRAVIDCQPLKVAPDTPLLEVITLMSQGSRGGSRDTSTPQHSAPAPGQPQTQRSSYILVVSGQQLVGIVTERDVVKLTAQGTNLTGFLVADVMTQQLITLQESCLQHPLTVLGVFRQHRIRHLPILNEHGQLVGVVTPNSIRRTLQSTDLFRLRRVDEVMATQVIDAPPETTVLSLAQLMATHRVSCVVITQKRDSTSTSSPSPVGIVTERDIVQFQALGLNLSTLQAQAVMSTPLRCLSSQDSLWKAHQTMEQMRVRRLVVTNDHGALAGILTQTNILAALDPAEMQKTIAVLQQQVEQLQDERMQWLQTRAAYLESQVQVTEQRYTNLAKVAPVGIFQTDADGNFLYVNDRWCQLAGLTLEAARGTGWIQGLHPEDREHVAATWYRSAQTQAPFCLEYRFQSPTGKITWVFGRAVAETENTERVSGYIGTITDITELKQAETALQQLNQELEARVERRTAELEASKELAQVTLHSIGDAVITTNALGQVEYINPVAERLTGWEVTAARGQPLTTIFQIVDEITQEPVNNPVECILREGCVDCLTHHPLLISKDGGEYSIEDSAAPIRDRQGGMIGAVMVFRDVTQSRQLAHQLSWQARHDALTGLANRRQFEQDLTETLQVVQQGNQVHVLCYLDLDQFKVVNDTCGHTAGDELLRQISRLLRGQIRAMDTLARLGGDEFGILLKHCPLEQAEIITEKLRKAVQNFRFLWQDRTFSIGVSIGLVALDAESCTLAEVLSAADAACYAAKDRGRNRIHIYQIDDSELVRQRGERRWSVRIKQALEDDRFCLYRQLIAPMIPPQEAQPTHYEVLLRMVDRQGELILPDAFIPAAERYDLMPHIDRWVVQTVFAQLERSQQLPSSVCEMAPGTVYLINLSGASVGDAQFLDFLKELFVQYAVFPQTIGFEITETAAIANLDQATHFIHELKRLGCSFALDDFGSGMSSFGYLKALPVDYLKIDGKFVKDIMDDPATYAIVESIHHIGHVMGLKTIAESVENPSLQEHLGTIGVDYVQGYGIAQPCPLTLS
ncbi:MAG: EAL domain-containing protein [Leptolyngbya sp. SIO1E4]|nr:EAL domain-containing protein [Leptolyngbya sp. SIO1E4]